MNADAVSDLVLAVVCGWQFGHHLRHRPGIAVAVALIGLAACLGVVHFSGFAVASGPHRFASLVAACAAFPLLAWSLRWPDDPVATQRRSAAYWATLLGAIGVAATVSGVEQWGQVVPGAAAITILWTMLHARSRMGILGAILLLASFVAAALVPPQTLSLAGLSRVQALHYLMAAALLALAPPWSRSLATRTA